MEIKNLEELVKPCLDNDTKILSWELNNFLLPGENYGSVMLKLDVKVKNKENKEETIHAIAKTPLPNEFIWEMFNVKVTFKIEIALYKTMLPIFNEFGRSKGIDNIMSSFAKCLNARISLDPESDVVDKDAVLLLENLKVRGFEVGNRFEGFDLESAELLLKDLAVMHATPIAFKLANPIQFEEKILPYLTQKRTPIPDAMADSFMKLLGLATSKNPECIPHIPKVETALKDFMKIPPNTVIEPFATLTHNDLWMNNTMRKFVNDKPQEAVILDFQYIEYGLSAHDLVFFIYSGVALPVLKEKGVEYFIKYYYESFIETLKKLGCDVEKFTFDELMNQCALVGKIKEFAHLIVMLGPIYMQGLDAQKLTENNLEDFSGVIDKTPVHENFDCRFQFIILDFVKRGWI